jgi:hypothetical protein
MKRHRIILQLESELAQVAAARADQPEATPDIFDDPHGVDLYWYGRAVGLAGALAYLKDPE